MCQSKSINAIAFSRSLRTPQVMSVMSTHRFFGLRLAWVVAAAVVLLLAAQPARGCDGSLNCCCYCNYANPGNWCDCSMGGGYYSCTTAAAFALCLARLRPVQLAPHKPRVIVGPSG